MKSAYISILIASGDLVQTTLLGGGPIADPPSRTTAKNLYHRLEFAANAYMDWLNDERQTVFNTDEGLTLVPCKKRGNEEYRRSINAKLNLSGKKFFRQLGKLYDYQRDRGTRAVFITLTYRSEYGVDAWEHVGEDYNRFMARFRKRFGKCDTVRVWESMQNGRPHIHAMVLVRKRLPSYMNKGRIWFSSSVWRDMKELWDKGWAKYDPVRNAAGSWRYILKYVCKAQAVSTLAQAPIQHFGHSIKLDTP